MQTDSFDLQAKKTLGDSGSYAVYTESFNSDFLNPLERKPGREKFHINTNQMFGLDVWFCHESTFLLDNGFPVSGVLRFQYDCNSEFMIESKSMKLYLNSFDQCKMGPSVKSATNNYLQQIKRDLEEKLQTKVDVSIKLRQSTLSSDFNFGFLSLDSVVDIENKKPIDDFTGKKDHLELVETQFTITQSFYTNVLRSRCQVTSQKDTGTAFIRSKFFMHKFKEESMLRQIISLRETNSFHEFCAEKLFTSFNTFKPKELFIALLYVRRGSLDINPVRTNSLELIPHQFIDVNANFDKTFQQ